MAYENNNEKQNKTVSTRGQRYMQSSVTGNCALEVSFYDDALKLTFSPELPENMRGEKRLYDYDNNVSTLVVRAKMLEFYNAYVEKIRPAIIAGEDASINIVIGGVNVLQCTTNIVDGVPHPKLILHKNLNEQLIPQNSYEYEFNTSEYIYGYNAETGEYKEKVTTYNEIELFFTDIKEAVAASSHAYIHTDRVVNKFWKDRLDENIKAIGAANGVNLSYSNRFNGGGSKGSIFDSTYNNKSSNPVANVASSMEDIDAALHMLN